MVVWGRLQHSCSRPLALAAASEMVVVSGGEHDRASFPQRILGDRD